MKQFFNTVIWSVLLPIAILLSNNTQAQPVSRYNVMQIADGHQNVLFGAQNVGIAELILSTGFRGGQEKNSDEIGAICGMNLWLYTYSFNPNQQVLPFTDVWMIVRSGDQSFHIPVNLNHVGEYRYHAYTLFTRPIIVSPSTDVSVEYRGNTKSLAVIRDPFVISVQADRESMSNNGSAIVCEDRPGPVYFEAYAGESSKSVTPANLHPEVTVVGRQSGRPRQAIDVVARITLRNEGLVPISTISLCPKITGRGIEIRNPSLVSERGQTYQPDQTGCFRDISRTIDVGGSAVYDLRIDSSALAFNRNEPLSIEWRARSIFWKNSGVSDTFGNSTGLTNWGLPKNITVSYE